MQKEEYSFQLDQSYRFKYEDYQKWQKYLKNYGFVVISSWLSQQQCQHYVSQFWSIIEYLSQGKVKRDDIETQILGKHYPPVLHGGMIQYIGHSKPQWELRKKCKPIFQKLWNTQSVKTSFDGFCFMNGHRNYKKTANNSFLHTDQSPKKNHLWSYQGIMTLTNAGKNGGGFVAVPESHKYHHQYFSDKKLLGLKENWYMFPQEDKVKQPLCNDLKVNTKAGDFILFDSRTFHCNAKPTEQTLRVCTYICMLPQEKIPEKTKQMRKKAIKQRRTSNHHSGDGFKTFPVLPRYLQNPKNFKKLIDQVNSFNLEADQQLIKMI